MHNERNIKNNLAYYLVDLAEAVSALSVVWESRGIDNHIDDKTISAINFISREIYDRNMALDVFLEDEDLTEFKSDKDICEILAARKRESASKED
ncbi:hypothetical protein LLW64_000165 [Salmonella enterica]|nr:hypothetical protein [Salmonella enterica]EGK1059232.1 hypothetical protein [Salmonella enterica]EIL4601263.1 hypothetical protein [Salmonella enterica]EKA9380106.1 hypothetical protein [Salmonella enterica]ELY8994398.1 hypothetical protein [Salmonella enterica]